MFFCVLKEARLSLGLISQVWLHLKHWALGREYHRKWEANVFFFFFCKVFFTPQISVPHILHKEGAQITSDRVISSSSTIFNWKILFTLILKTAFLISHVSSVSSQPIRVHGYILQIESRLKSPLLQSKYNNQSKAWLIVFNFTFCLRHAWHGRHWIH